MEDVESVLEKAEQAIINFEKELGWTDEIASFVTCPCNPTHFVSAKNLESHSSKCKWKMLGYTDEEVEDILDDQKLCHGSLLHLDKIIKEVAPQTTVEELLTHERYVSALTPEQRLQIYEAIVSNFKQERLSKLDPFLYEDLDERKKAAESNNAETSIDIMKKYRDLSRRRQSYRAKNVHITKRSHTEVLRDVLAVHMEQLRKIWNPNDDDDAGSDTRNERGTSDQSQRVSLEDRSRRREDIRSQRSPSEDRLRRKSREHRSQRSPPEDRLRRKSREHRSQRSPSEDRLRRKSREHRSQRSPSEDRLRIKPVEHRSHRSPVEDRSQRKSKKDKKLKRSRSRSNHSDSEDRSLKKRKKDRCGDNQRADEKLLRELKKEKAFTCEKLHHKKSHKQLESSNNETTPKHKKKKKKHKN